jgi:hypothetical protein
MALVASWYVLRAGLRMRIGSVLARGDGRPGKSP